MMIMMVKCSTSICALLFSSLLLQAYSNVISDGQQLSEVKKNTKVKLTSDFEVDNTVNNLVTSF
jgi:hypothetical protein